MELFSRIRPTASLLALLIAALLLLQSPLFGQATTGSVTGIVADSTGAVIPHASVELTNQQTGITRKTVSNGVGSFTFAAVEPSIGYTIKVMVAKFRPWESQPFALRPGDYINLTDIRLVVGAETEQVTVEASTSTVKDLDTGERADVITAKDIETLAVVGRDATELVRMLPGFDMSTGSQGVNNKPGYNTAVVGLSGPTGSFSANGSGTNGISVVADGVSLTDIGSNSGTVQNVNMDNVQEIKVSTSAYSAESAEGPALVNVVSKTGTSKFHGSAYFYARDTVLNANDWYNNFLRQTRPEGRYYYPGGSLNGPLLLPFTHFNHNRDKLFFSLQLEYSNQLFSPETLGSWVPTQAERKGDFSQASLNAQLCGARPDGAANPNAILPMCQTQNFLPNGTGVINGNVSSQSDANGLALINWLPQPNADPFNNIDGFNYVKEVLQNQNGDQFNANLQYHINDNNILTMGYGRQSQIAQDPVNLGYIPVSSILYPGSVTSGDISNILHAQYTRTIGATVTNEASAAMSFVSSPGNMGTPAAVDRFETNTYNGGNGDMGFLGMYKNGGDYSIPALSGYGGLGYPNMLMPGGFYANKVRMKKVVPDVQDILTWSKGTHLFKAGVYFKKGILNGLADYGAFPQGEFTFNPGNGYFQYSGVNSQEGNGDSIGTTAQFTGCESSDPLGNDRLSGAAYLGECMNPSALMYMGYADSFTQTNFSPTVDMQYTTVSGFIQDDWRIRRVTLNLGLRLEHLGAWSDRHGNGLATFSPSLYGSECAGYTLMAGRHCGGVNMPGLTWHGINSEVDNSVNWTPNLVLSPRFGLSWDVFGKGNTVLRGGWGVYRSQEEFNPYAMAAATAQGYKTSFLQGGLTFGQIDSTSPTNPPDFSAYTISPDDTNRPIHLEYNFTISQQLTWKWLRSSLLEFAYVGNEGKHLSSYNNGYNSISNINLMPYGTLFNAPFEVVEDNATLWNGSDGSSPTDSSLNTAEQDVYRPYSFYTNIYVLNHNYYSSYNSAQVTWNKTAGRITFGANYTFSKNLATASSYNNNVADPFNLRNEYNPVPFDRTHVFNVHYLIDLGTHYRLGFKPLNEVVNGWQISGISTLQSGPPLASINGENFGFGYGLISPVQVATKQQGGPDSTCITVYHVPADANGNHFCVTQLNPITWLGTPDIQLLPTITCNPAGGPAKNQYINGACFGIPLPGQNGQLRPPYLRGPAFMNHDLTMLKNVNMGEKKNLQLRAAAFNFLNHPLVSFNNNDTTSDLALSQQGGTAGQSLKQSDLTAQGFGIAAIKYGGRLIELSVKYQF
ncbi:MAG: TonB-dependent receptor [Terracidiphilus sp.]